MQFIFRYIISFICIPISHCYRTYALPQNNLLFLYYYSAAYFHKAASVTSDKLSAFLASFHVTLLTEKKTT